MNFPPVPTCHHQSGEPMYRGLDKAEWRPPREGGEPYFETFRTCWYCGSINPEDLVRFSKEHTLKMDLADRKYGYPHKMYVEGIPNKVFGQTVKTGIHSYYDEEKDVRVEEPIMGSAPEFVHAKFYTQHFFDKGYDDEALVALNEAIRSSGYSFRTEDGKLFWLPV